MESRTPGGGFYFAKIHGSFEDKIPVVYLIWISSGMLPWFSYVKSMDILFYRYCFPTNDNDVNDNDRNNYGTENSDDDNNNDNNHDDENVFLLKLKMMCAGGAGPGQSPGLERLRGQDGHQLHERGGALHDP